MKRSVMVLVVLALVGVGSTALAQQYAALKIGPYFPEESGLDTGFNIRAAYGLGLEELMPSLVRSTPALSNVALEVGIGYYTADFSEKASTTIPGLGTSTTSVDGDIDVIPLTLSAIYNYPVEKTGFDVFAGGGLGLYFAFQEAKAKVSVTDPLTGQTLVMTQSDDDSDVEVGIHLGAGGAYHLNEQIDLTAEFQYGFVTDDIGGGFLNFGARYRF